MKDHNANITLDTAAYEAEGPNLFEADEFDAARVFADPVGYLAAFGLRCVLEETQHPGFPAAA